MQSQLEGHNRVSEAGFGRYRKHLVRTNAVWLLGILGLIAALPFVPVLGNGFVYWDDDVNFFQNPYLRGLDWSTTRWAWHATRLGVYQPLAWMLIEAECSIWGQRAWGYHLCGVFLHALNAVALAALTIVLLTRQRIDPPDRLPRFTTVLSASLAAAVFAVHPARVEVVAWASCQPYLPCALCSLLAVLAYLFAHPADGRRRWGWLLAAWLLYAAALLCKAAAVGLVMVFIILDVYPLGRVASTSAGWFDRNARRVWAEKIPFAILSLAAAVVAMNVREPGFAAARPGLDAPSARVAKACYGVWFYPIETLIPAGLAMYHPLPRHLGLREPRFFIAFAGTALLALGLVLGRRRWPALLAALGCYVAILTPNLGIVGLGENLVAERYGYIPTMALFVLVAAGLERLIDRLSPRAVAAACVVLLACLGALSWQQCRAWRSTEILFAQAMARYGDDPFIRGNLGAELLARGAFDEAERQLREALRLDPRHSGAHSNLALLLGRRGQVDAAETHFRDAIRCDPAFPDAHHGLGLLLVQRGRLDEAEEQFNEALRLRSEYAEALDSLGSLMLRRGRVAEAEVCYKKALRLDPDDVRAYCGIGTALNRRSRVAAAADMFRHALARDPHCVEAHAKLGTILARQGRADDAILHLSEAVRLAPDLASAHLNLGLALASQGRAQRAAREFARVLELRPDDAQAKASLDALQARAGATSAAP